MHRLVVSMQPQIKQDMFRAPSPQAKSVKNKSQDDDNCYCSSKLLIRFVDMMTYPRPIRKYTFLLEPTMRLELLRAIVQMEKCVEGDNKISLRHRGKLLDNERYMGCVNEGGVS